MPYKPGWGFRPPISPKHCKSFSAASVSLSSQHPSGLPPPSSPSPPSSLPPHLLSSPASLPSPLPPPPPTAHFKLTFEDDYDEDNDTDFCIETKATVGATMSHIDNTGKKKEQQLPYTTSKLESSMISGPNREPYSQPLGFAVDLDRELGGKFRNLWPYRILNEVQSAFWPVCFNTDHNVVIAAPTGVGKTMALEAAICRLLQEDEGTGNGRKTWKAVYVAPVKALCQQRLVDWQRRFETRFGLKCAELTGDSAGMREVAASQIILTTPEKFDAVSRDWRDNLYLLGSVRLVLIDEAHFLGEDPRGSALEALICRLRVMKSHKVIMDKGLPASKLRILAASATLPNVEDIGRWLEAPPEATFNFDYTHRPVPLEIHVLGYANASNPFLFQRTLEGRAPEVIGRYSEGKATLVFCGSKKGAEALATKLAEAGSGLGLGNKQLGRGGMQGRSQQRLEAERFSNIQNHKLKDLLLTSDGAVAFHHAGLTAEDRTCVETLFQQGVVRTLCSTSTLAQGINSPAFLAIILGTTFWRGAGTGYEDLPVSAVLQMIGRAGRPGNDDRGVAVIMTSKEKELMYMSMAEGQEVVESQLPARFHESLNAEVCSNVISDLGGAIRWLRSTFLWVRAHRNPDYYTALLPRGTVCRDADNSIGEYLKAYMLRILAELQAENVLRLEKTVGLSRDGAPIDDLETENIVPLVAGRVMSKTLVSFETIKILRAVPSDASLEDLLYACCGCPEVCNPVRKAEKRPLNDLLKRVRFSKGLGIKKCTHPSHKAFVLVQACLGNLEIVDFTLKLEAETILDNVTRILKANQQLCVDTGRGMCAYLSLVLCRSIRARMWETERGAILLRQVEGIGGAYCQKLGVAGIDSFQGILSAMPSKLEAICHRRHPWGLEVIQLVSEILDSSWTMHVSQISGTSSARGDAVTLLVELSRSISKECAVQNNSDPRGGSERTTLQRRKKWWLNSTLVAFSSDPDRNLLLFREISVSSSRSTALQAHSTNVDHRIEFSVPRPAYTDKLKGEDKRFRVTLALISPFVSLDCLQIFYPTFLEKTERRTGLHELKQNTTMAMRAPNHLPSPPRSKHCTTSLNSDKTDQLAMKKTRQPAPTPNLTLNNGDILAKKRLRITPENVSLALGGRKTMQPAIIRSRHDRHKMQNLYRKDEEMRPSNAAGQSSNVSDSHVQKRRELREFSQELKKGYEPENHVQGRTNHSKNFQNEKPQRRAYHDEAQVLVHPSVSNIAPKGSAATAKDPTLQEKDHFCQLQFKPSQESPFLNVNEMHNAANEEQQKFGAVQVGALSSLPPSVLSSYGASQQILSGIPLNCSPSCWNQVQRNLNRNFTRDSKGWKSDDLSFASQVQDYEVTSGGDAELSLLQAKAQEMRTDQVPIDRVSRAAALPPLSVKTSNVGPILSRKVVGISSRVGSRSTRELTASKPVSGLLQRHSRDTSSLSTAHTTQISQCWHNSRNEQFQGTTENSSKEQWAYVDPHFRHVIDDKRSTSPNSQGNYEQSEAIGSEKAQVPLLTPPCNASPREPPTKYICKQQRARVLPFQANIEIYPPYHDPSQRQSLIASSRHLRHVYESDECHLVDAVGNVENFAEAFDAAGFF